MNILILWVFIFYFLIIVFNYDYYDYGKCIFRLVFWLSYRVCFTGSIFSSGRDETDPPLNKSAMKYCSVREILIRIIEKEREEMGVGGGWGGGVESK